MLVLLLICYKCFFFFTIDMEKLFAARAVELCNFTVRYLIVVKKVGFFEGRGGGADWKKKINDFPCGGGGNVLPNHQRLVATLEVGICSTHCICTFFARWAPICMLSRCLVTQFAHSELSRKFIKSALLVGYECQRHRLLPHLQLVVN